MSSTPEVVAWIREREPDWKPADAEIATALNGELTANPTEAPMVLPVLSAMVLFQDVSAESRKALALYVNLPAILAEIRAGQRSAVCNWIMVLAAAEIVTAEEAGDAIDYLVTPAPDPDHPAEIPVTVAELGRLVAESDVAAARYQVTQGAISAKAAELRAANAELTEREALQQADEELRNGE